MYRRGKPIVKIIRHQARRKRKREERRAMHASEIQAKEFAIALENYPELKDVLIGEVEYFEVAEPSVVVSQREGRLGLTSRPERAPEVVRIITGDPSLNERLAEAVIKRRRIDDLVVEIINMPSPA